MLGSVHTSTCRRATDSDLRRHERGSGNSSVQSRARGGLPIRAAHRSRVRDKEALRSASLLSSVTNVDAPMRIRLTNSRQSGFTLVELVTAITIISILAAVAVPKLLDQQAFNERGYADELASSLRAARQVAIASSCPVSVNVQANGYRARQRNVLATCDVSGGWNRQVIRADGSALRGTAPTGITATPQTIVFNSTGDVSNGQPSPIAIGPFTIVVNRLGGNVAVTP